VCDEYNKDKVDKMVLSLLYLTTFDERQGACLEGGDVIEWVMHAEGISSRHAVELLERDHLPSAASTTEPPPKQSTVPHCGSYVSFD
jgi:hypothetical protein